MTDFIHSRVCPAGVVLGPDFFREYRQMPSAAGAVPQHPEPRDGEGSSVSKHLAGPEDPQILSMPKLQNAPADPKAREGQTDCRDLFRLRAGL